MSEIRLIVNADDFGMSRGIADAIIIAHRYGFLTSTSLMANLPAADYAVSRARNFPKLALGVHLNICQDRPLLPPSEVPTLVGPDGTFYSPRELARRLWTRRVAPDEIEREFQMQIRWMKERGIAPSHADSHHHMHLYPAAASAFARALATEGIRTARACHCIECPKGASIGAPYNGSALRRFLVEIYRRGLQRTLFWRLQSPHGRVVISPTRLASAPRLECWKAAIENLPPGTFELACHPGLFEGGFSESDAIRTQREEELLCLTDRDLLRVIEARGIRLITYHDLLQRGPATLSTAEKAA
jgi:chitin disaccharide deacetylase